MQPVDLLMYFRDIRVFRGYKKFSGGAVELNRASLAEKSAEKSFFLFYKIALRDILLNHFDIVGIVSFDMVV
jgi:hypothetical protein